MPCVSLSSKKVYKATTFKAWHRSMADAEPVSAADLLPADPADVELLTLAQPAIEIQHELEDAPEFDPTVVCTDTLTSAGVKAPKESLRRRMQLALVQPVKLKSLRRSALKAARRPLTSQTGALAHTFQTNSDLPQELIDGAKVQIRQTRRPLSRAATKIVSDAPVSTPKATPKSKKSKTRKTLKRAGATVQATATTVAKTLRRRPTRAELINAESRLGSTIFGPIPEGHRREFFHDRDNIWIWHESWLDPESRHRQLTVRYEVRPTGVFKKISAGHYVQLEGAELENFRRATHTYLRLIKQRLYC